MAARLIRLLLAFLVFQAVATLRSRETSELTSGRRVASILKDDAWRPPNRSRLAALTKLVELGDQVADDSDGTEDEVRPDAARADQIAPTLNPPSSPLPRGDRLRSDPRLRAQKLRC
jgi:hypothetical protein